MNPRMLAHFVMIALVGVMLAGCHSAVRFESHAPYNAPRRFPEPLIIVHPDDMEEAKTTARVGSFMRPRRFPIRHGEALKWESIARFGGMFTGIFLISESDFAALGKQEDEGTGTEEDGEADTEDDVSPSTSDDDVGMYKLSGDQIGQPGYILRMSRVAFLFEGQRASYLVQFEFSDRENGEELFRGVMRGRGTSVTVRESTDFMVEELRQSVIAANTSLLNPMAERMYRAIMERGPRAPRAAPQETTPDAAVADPASEEETAEREEPVEPPHPRLRPFFATPE